MVCLTCQEQEAAAKAEKYEMRIIQLQLFPRCCYCEVRGCIIFRCAL